MDFEEIEPEGREVIVVDDDLGNQGEEVEVKNFPRDQEGSPWEESCLLRFSKFLGMALEGYEEEILDLKKKISNRRQKGKGKGGAGFD